MVAAIGAMSCESSGKASARGLMSPTTGVAWRRASAACCSLACLMELISGEEAQTALRWSSARVPSEMTKFQHACKCKVGLKGSRSSQL